MTPQAMPQIAVPKKASPAVPQSASEAIPRTKTVPQSASLANCSLRDVVIFASKQIFERGFEALNLCYFDFGLDIAELATLANLFNDVDGDKVERERQIETDRDTDRDREVKMSAVKLEEKLIDLKGGFLWFCENLKGKAESSFSFLGKSLKEEAP